ncbi:PREDICTED: selenocysteine insertion sequence-binding protein 2 [Condylura cristata]|uniref:selenocysteine insertion sequence-binding protein 2 n=1 Tax=Condylura cristata TaxID=143302 RepID=UPI000642CCB7|nr:PREDICTED: selenocysteine insertion sequence-binding protein 2 [Condylura cristata]
MASERQREPPGEGIKLSADVKPFVPKFAGLSVAWTESSEACVLPSCAAPYYPGVQELPVPEQKHCTEDRTLGASSFSPQHLPSEMALHPYAYSPYTLESTQNVCPVPGSQYDYSQPRCYRGFQTAKRHEHMGPLPQDSKALFKKKTYDEQKFDNKKADGALSSDIKSVKGSHPMSTHAENSLKSDGCHKRTDRKSRIIEKSGPVSTPEFEFTRLDFPELQGSENSERSENQKPPKWGPLRSASTNISLLREVGKPVAVLSEGEIVVKKNNPAESVTDNAAANPSSCIRELSWTPMGYVVRQTLPTQLSPAPKHVTSMINPKTVPSSADPKTVSLSSPKVLPSDPSSKEKHVTHPSKKPKAAQCGDPEQSEVSRKNKRKKEKSEPNYEVLTVQEPPRIEDAEEFPNLAVASERRDRVDSPKFPSKQQPQNNFKNSAKKSQIPVQLDLGGMLTALEKKQHAQNAKQSSKPVVFSVGAVPVLSKEAASGKKGHRFSEVKTPHNPLDSSAPLTKKGKQREVPKAKKPTSLKKIILKERQERMQQRLQENVVSPAFASDDVRHPESGGDDQSLEQVEPSGGADTVSASEVPAMESKSEEWLGAKTQKEAEACPPAPDSTCYPKIHSRRFRDYCSQMLSKEVDACVTDLLKELVRFQDRMYQKDPVKAKTKRRLVLGLREVLKHLKLRKLKCIIISPNCEKIQSKGGLDDTLHTIIDCACEQNIPFVFALNRKALGRSLNKAVPVSVVGIFSYDGAQDQFHKMVELTMAARQAYKALLENVHQELVAEPGPPALTSPHEPGPSCSTDQAFPAPTGKEEPHYIEVWKKQLEAYNQCALELEDSLEASTSQMMNLSL